MKVKYTELQFSDFRYKLTWEKAINIIQLKQQSFDEYQGIFGEIEASFQQLDQKLAQGKHLVEGINLIADDLELLTHELEGEASNLEIEVQLASEHRQQGELN